VAKIKTQSVKRKKSSAKAKPSSAVKQAEATAKRVKSGKAAKPKAARPVTVRGIPFKMKPPEKGEMRMLEETYYTKKGLSLRQLVRNTPRLFINNAVSVEAHRYKKMKTRTGKPAVQGIMWTNCPFRPDKTRRYHETFIIGLDDDQTKPVHTHKKVIVQCSCQNFMYYFEYANARYGASYIMYSNGEPPVWTNPRMAFGCCKHIIALAKIAMEKDL